MERDSDWPFSRPISFLPTNFTYRRRSVYALCPWSRILMLIGKYSDSSESSNRFTSRTGSRGEVMANVAKRNRCGFPILKRAIARYDLVLGLNRIPGRVKSRPRAIRVNASRRSHVAAPKWSRYRCCRQCPFDSSPRPTHARTHATWTKCKPVYARY